MQFDGPRYRADLEERYITWMGWSFYLGYECEVLRRPADCTESSCCAVEMGQSLWDITFRGERIIYELSPQEAMAQYSGNDPRQASTVWLDRAFG
jgi:primary-amine oxidase